MRKRRLFVKFSKYSTWERKKEVERVPLGRELGVFYRMRERDGEDSNGRRKFKLIQTTDDEWVVQVRLAHKRNSCFSSA